MPYILIVRCSTWPKGEQTHHTEFQSIMAMRPTLRGWKRFAELEDNYVLDRHIKYEEERDFAHEADMCRLRREQMLKDMWDDVLEVPLDDYDF